MKITQSSLVLFIKEVIRDSKKSAPKLMRYGLVGSKLLHRLRLYFPKLKISRPRRVAMSHQALREYLLAIVDRYLAAGKAEKSKMLDEAVLVTKLSRKQLIRRLNAGKENLEQRKASGRPRKYPRELLRPHIEYLWINMERISAKRMKSALPEWLQYYPNEQCPAHLKLMLITMSAATLARILRDIRGSLAIKKGIATTCPARFMKNKVPINTLDVKVTRPGYTQSDTVAHCGNNACKVLLDRL